MAHELLRKRLRRLIRPRLLALHATRPLDDRWGRGRGTPVDRYYIERFLEENRDGIRGSVLEVKDSLYTDRFGSGVEQRSVLDVNPMNERATIVGDLANADSVPADSFDCFILTQTLQYVYDVKAAVVHAHRILRPGGLLLCTVPSVTRVDPGFLDAEYWRFTVPACRRLFEDVFGQANVVVRAHGNVLAGIAFLAGIAAEELRGRQLDYQDDYFPVVITIRARKALPSTDQGAPRAT